MVKLHKEQFGRCPTNARSYFAGPDTLVCTLENSLLPAERTMVEMGEHQRVRESRLFLQVATQDSFIAAVEALVSRKVRAFASAIDPAPGVVCEVFSFQPKRHTPRRIHTHIAGRRMDDDQASLDPVVRLSLRSAEAGVVRVLEHTLGARPGRASGA